MTITSDISTSQGAFAAPSRRARLIAFYLPQFHPIPENDKWWGGGFTEWRNVAKARPLFPGHYQPHLPSELGFYDLRVPETRQAQDELARSHGIEGFCYWHYWFNGKRLLERPFQEVLTSGKPDLPFCLAWANEPWSRRWDGLEKEVLQPQVYSDEDDRSHIAWLMEALRDPRAIRVDGRPVFLVYRPTELPNPVRTVGIWREAVERAGLPGLYLIAVEHGERTFGHPEEIGFDATVLFQPQWGAVHAATDPSLAYRSPNPLVRLRNLADIVRGRQPLALYDYRRTWPYLAGMGDRPYTVYHTVCTGWDNSPRRDRGGFILHGSTPAEYGAWLERAVQRVESQPFDRRLVFINAWNEWAEGAHLEPDLKFGRAYLEASRQVVVQR